MSSNSKFSELLRKYDRPVPRYTSYPTAVQFKNGAVQEDYMSALSALDPARDVSLYVHIPFCHILCHYCGCHTQVINSYKPAENYLSLLLREIEKVGKALTSPIIVSRLHFGGGSPNFLKPEDLGKIIETLKLYFTFADDAEIDMEMDPRLLTKDNIFGYVKTGMTRVSFGVQDFDPAVQKAVNREQSYDLVRDCVNWFREAGLKHINFDLMYGLPLQTMETIERGVEQAVSLNPDRFAVFGYAHVPWMKKHQKLLEKYDFPDPQLRHNMSELMREKLEEFSYRAIGIDHFAKDTDSLYKAFAAENLKRNFQGYTDDQASTLIGFGVSSISSFSDIYTQNASNAAKYREAILRDDFPIERACKITEQDKRRRAAIEYLMCYFKLDISGCPELEHEFARFEADGLIERVGNEIIITQEGRPFVRVVASCFDAYLKPAEKNRHAQAV